MENSTVALTPEEISVISDCERAVHDIQQQLQGALTLMIRSRKLEGRWSLKDGALVRVE